MFDQVENTLLLVCQVRNRNNVNLSVSILSGEKRAQPVKRQEVSKQINQQRSEYI